MEVTLGATAMTFAHIPTLTLKLDGVNLPQHPACTHLYFDSTSMAIHVVPDLLVFPSDGGSAQRRIRSKT